MSFIWKIAEKIQHFVDAIANYSVEDFMAGKGNKEFFVRELEVEPHTDPNEGWEVVKAKNEKQAAELYIANKYSDSTDYTAEYTVEVKKSLTASQVKVFIVRQEVEVEYFAEAVDVEE